MADPDPDRPAGTLERCGSPAFLGLLFVALAAWSWRKWPDPLVDFGQQLYVPWRIVSGDVLYRDIYYLHGPLSPYLNALLFALFGTSLTTLVLANLAILAAVTAVAHRIVAISASRLAATAACAVFLAVFAFSQYVRVGNYNFVCPYVHEATHGVALAAAMILLLSRYAALSGLCLGLALLTKADMALAASATAALGWALVLRGTSSPRRRVLGDLARFAAAALAPGAAFLLYFLTKMPPAAAVRAVCGAWASVRGEVARNPFYMHALGLDRAGMNLLQMSLMSGWMVAFVLAGAGLAVAARRKRIDPYLAGAVPGVALLVLTLARPAAIPWKELPRALPVAVAILLVALLAAHLGRARAGERPGFDRDLPLLLWNAFALALLLKIVLNVHLFHFGFYMAMPATLALVAGLLHTLPRVIDRAGGHGATFRLLALSAIASGIVFHLFWSNEIYRHKDFVVGRGGDAFLAYGPETSPVAQATVTALRSIEEQLPRDATFVALPEGVMLNYLSRHRTPTRCINYMMTEMIVFGEERLLEDLKVARPDYILLVHKETREFGVGYFGADPRYGRRIMGWVEWEYAPYGLIGHEPLKDGRFGIEILKRVREEGPQPRASARPPSGS